jgi:hypothetical protein
MVMGRPTKGLTKKLLVRMSDEEDWMVRALAEQLNVSLNDAVRVSIRRGWARVPGPADAIVDGPVLDPNWTPRDHLPPSVQPIDGQTSIDIEGNEDD